MSRDLLGSPIYALEIAPECTGRGVSVAVIDSGWDRSIANPRVADGVSFVDSSSADSAASDHDSHGHGTKCAHVIHEMAPGCTLVPIRVFGSTLETSPGVLCDALRFASKIGVRIINLSLGTLLDDAMKEIYIECELARRNGLIIVAASRSGEMSYPAVFEPVIGVGALELKEPYSIFFSEGAAIECTVGVTRRKAIGLRGEVGVLRGASSAAPIVTGVVARWLEQQPGLDVDGVRQNLRFASDRFVR